MKGPIIFFSFFVIMLISLEANASLVSENYSSPLGETAPSKIYITKKVFNEELSLMQKRFSFLAEEKKYTLEIYPDWDATTWANALARRWPPEDQIIVYSGLAYRKEFLTDTLALGVCHELGHLYGGVPYSDNYNQISGEGQADYWATTNCFVEAMNLFDYKDDDSTPRIAVKNFCETQTKFSSALCIRLLKAVERLGSFFAHNAKLPEPHFETPDQGVVNQTVLTHNDPQCRVDTFMAGLFGGDRPKCWYKF